VEDVIINAAQTANESSYNLTDFISISYLQTIQDTFSNIMNIASVIVDLNGSFITKPSNFCSLCKLHWESEGKNNCVNLYKNLGNKAGKSGEVETITCEMFGLVEIGYPIFIKGHHVATMLAGQVRKGDISKDKVRQYASLIGADPDKILQALSETPVKNSDELNKAIDLLKLLAKEISRVASLNDTLGEQLKFSNKKNKIIKKHQDDRKFINNIFSMLFETGDSLNIEEVLMEIGRYYGSERVYILEKIPHTDYYRRSYVWSKTNLSINQAKIQSSKLSPIINILKKNNVFYIRGFNNENVAPLTPLNYTGVKSSVLLSLYASGDFIGFLAVDFYMEREELPDEDINFLTNIAYLIGRVLDKKLYEESENNSKLILQTVLSNTDLLIFVTDLYTKEVLFANKNLCDRLQCSQNDIISRKCCDTLGDICPYSNQKCISERLFKEGKVTNYTYETEIYNHIFDKWYAASYSIIKWADGRLALMHRYTDITKNKMYELQFQKMAYTDAALGIPNRYRCEQVLKKYIDEAELQGKTGGVMLVDLDNFKIINDAFGHANGDILLQSVVNFFSTLPFVKDSFYRYGGDEFIILLHDQPNEFVMKTASRIMERFKSPWSIPNKEIYCTVSIGISFYPESGYTVEDIIKKADIAMYRAKMSGKDAVAVFDNKIDSEFISKTETETCLRNAIKGGCSEFMLYFQPIINLKIDKVVGAEALIRWQSPKLGLVYPGSFIPIAENTGLIHQLGEWALKEACKCCKEWQDSGLEKIDLSVNFSMRQFQDPDLPNLIKRILKETRLSPESLTIEITESFQSNDYEMLINTIEIIRSMGIRSAMDDFGVGYASLGNLKRIPIDIIKIDRSLLKALDTDLYYKIFLRSVIELAHNMGLKVCVEGVETQVQKDYTTMLRSDLAQGYFISEPLPFEEFVTFVNEYNNRKSFSL